MTCGMCCCVWWLVPALLLAYVVKQLMAKKGNAVKFQGKFFLCHFLMLFFTGLYLPILAVMGRNVKNCLYMAPVMKHISRLFGLKFELRRGHILAEDKGFVVVANHQSTIDALGFLLCDDRHPKECEPMIVSLKNFHLYLGDVMAVVAATGAPQPWLALLPDSNRSQRLNVYDFHTYLSIYNSMFSIWNVLQKCAIVSKKEVFYIWPFGLAAYFVGMIFIDRSNPKKAYEQLEATSRLMVNEKTKIWVFPEGTRYQRGGMLPFRRGAFKKAVAAQVPVVPVVYSPYYFINKEKQYFGPGRIIITALDPIETKGLTDDDIPKLMEKTRDIMLEVYNKVSKELSGLPTDYLE